MLGTLNHDEEEPRPTRELQLIAYATTYLHPPEVWWMPDQPVAKSTTSPGAAWTFPGGTITGGPR